jgi:hypothetical protein
MKYIKKLELNEFIVTEKLARGLKPLLTIGSTINKKAGEDALVDLSDKFDEIDDEQADDVASHLNMAIELMQDGYPGDATKKLKQFNKVCKDVLNGKEVGSAFESVTEAKYSKGYQKLGKLGYDDQFRSRVSLSKTLSEDLGFNPKKEFTEGVGFDNTSLYDVPTGNTIVANALNDEYTYDQLLKIAKDWYNKNESADVNEAKKFKPGDMWSNDFDYDGMMKYALKVNHKTSLKDLAKLHASATDVNYHTPFKGLGNAIDWITDDGVDSKEGKDFMKQFHNDIKDEIKKMK